MLLTVTWLVIFSAALAWRVSGPVMCLAILLVGAGALALLAGSWHPLARREVAAAPQAPVADLERLLLRDVDAYVRKRLSEGESTSQIATSASWLSVEGDA